jgi:hypothetical protein
MRCRQPGADHTNEILFGIDEDHEQDVTRLRLAYDPRVFSRKTARGSAKTVTASSKVVRCFSAFSTAFRSSQANRAL